MNQMTPAAPRTLGGAPAGADDFIPKEDYVSPAFAARERERLWPRVNRHNMGLAPIMHPGTWGRYDVYQRHTTRVIPLVLLKRNTAES